MILRKREDTRAKLDQGHLETHPVRYVYCGNSATLGVTRLGATWVGPPLSSMTLEISPRLSRATVIMWWKRTLGVTGTSMARVSVTLGWRKTL